MSKFIDNLKQSSQAMPQPMGFGRARPPSLKTRMLFVASLAQADLGGLADCVAGADAGLLRVSELSSGAKALQKVSQVVPDIPWGGWLSTDGQGEIKQMTKAGCDFLVFPAADTSLARFQGSKVGRILEVGPSLSDSLLRAVSRLPVDAVLVAGELAEGRLLTWQHLILFQRFADLLTKPLLVSIPLGVTAGEVKVLWEAGVDGVVVEVGDEQSSGRLEALRRAVDKLDFSLLRRQEKVEALLPHIGGESDIVTEEDEEEE